MKKLEVKTPANSYEIMIERGFLANFQKTLLDFSGKKKIFLVTNDTIHKLYSDFTNKFENKIIIKDGEEYKNIDTYYYIINELLRQKIERGDLIAAFGGGVTGDITGFAASTVLRGVNFAQIPTTLLAQVDSSVGGKTGINTKFGKNLLGAFYQPKVVLVDPNILKTLPNREIKSGYGEIVKYAFIQKNCTEENKYHLLDYLQKNVETEDVIYRCCALKAAVVSKDEKESGLREVLNLGHTFAHAIETITNYNKYTHGEAVAMGIKMAFRVSLNLGLIEKSYYDEMENLLHKFELVMSFDIDFDKDKFIEIMHSDKKVKGSKIRLVLPIHRGEVKIFDDIDEDEIKRGALCN